MHFDVGRGMWHGGREHAVRHVGDLGNVEADKRGDVLFTIFDRLISLNGPNSVIGRAAIVSTRPPTVALPQFELTSGDNLKSTRF